MIMKFFNIICCGVAAMLSTQTYAQELTSLTAADVTNYTKSTTRQYAGIHDPSIVQYGSQFYIMGSHRGFARSTDLKNWTALDMRFAKVNADGSTSSCGFEQAFSTHQTRKVRALVNGEVREVDFGNYDAEAWAHADDANYNISGNLWAPDIIYNPTMRKWCMYMSVNGDNWHSVIVLLTSNTINGEYVYQGPVTFSGFINGTNSAISWKKTDLELVLGTQSSLPSRYNKGSDWGWHWPNDIDPCVFYDTDSTLWMTYGSWSGGIFMLKLDPTTGLRDYTVTYPLVNVWGDHASSDPYFGKRIAGGDYASGEGSYIQKIGNYYYLFMSYGGLDSVGGYVMRLFRSENPDGPFVDSRGNTATYDRYALNFGPNSDNRGDLIMSAYSYWGFQQEGEGRVAQGHNSAFVDNKGRAFVVYHTRFDNGTEWFQDRVHQLFQNKQGWLVCAPFEYNGETITQEDIENGCQFTKEEIPGSYSLLLHRYGLDHTELQTATPTPVTLSSDGKVSGDYDISGTWKLEDGTGYITLYINNVRYYGVVTEQTVEGSTAKAICISALSSNTGAPLWAYKMEPQYAVAYTAKDYAEYIGIKNNETISKNFELPIGLDNYGATIEWTSSVPEVLSLVPDKGWYWAHYNPADTITPVTLTCRISVENCYYDQVFEVKAARNTISDSQRDAVLSPLVAYYDFEQTVGATVNQIDETQKMTFSKGTNGTKPTLEKGNGREKQFVFIYEGETTAKSSYTYCPNPLQGKDLKDGFSVSLWVLLNGDDTSQRTLPIWSITDKRANMSNLKQTLYFTPNVMVGFTTEDDYFYANKPADENANGTGYMSNFEWRFVTFTCDSTGIATYINGVKKALKSFESSAGTATSPSKAAVMFDYAKVLDMVSSAEFLQLGLGVKGLGSPNFAADDLMVHQKALSSSEAATLNRLATRVTDFTSGIFAVPFSVNTFSGAVSDGVIRDLSGRRVAAKDFRSLPAGIYIVNGRKIKK